MSLNTVERLSYNPNLPDQDPVLEGPDIDIRYLFFRELRQRPRLDSSGNQLLFEKWAQGDLSVRGQIVEGNIPLVVSIAKKYIGRGDVPLMELVQAGSIALINAADEFDLRRQCTFSTAAFQKIRKAIWVEREKSSSIFNLPIDTDRALNTKPNGKGFVNGGKRVSSKRYYALKLAAEPVLSLDQEGKEGLSLHEVIADSVAEDPEEKAVEGDTARFIDRVTGQVLSLRQKKVIELHYGLLNGSPKTYEDIGLLMGLSAQRIQQIEKKALAELRKSADLQQLRYAD